MTFEEGRAYLGLEIQRQWSDQAIARTTPTLLSLYSIITLTAHQRLQKAITVVRVAAWYAKIRPTFAAAMALVWRQLWDQSHISTSQHETETTKRPRVLFDRLIDMVCYAA